MHEQAGQQRTRVSHGEQAALEMLHIGTLSALADEQVEYRGSKAYAADGSQGEGE
jgi:hypothetical protein